MSIVIMSVGEMSFRQRLVSYASGEIRVAHSFLKRSTCAGRWQVIYAHISVTRGLAGVTEIALRSSLLELHYFLYVILAMVR